MRNLIVGIALIVFSVALFVSEFFPYPKSVEKYFLSGHQGMRDWVNLGVDLIMFLAFVGGYAILAMEVKKRRMVR